MLQSQSLKLLLKCVQFCGRGRVKTAAVRGLQHINAQYDYSLRTETERRHQTQNVYLSGQKINEVIADPICIFCGVQDSNLT